MPVTWSPLSNGRSGIYLRNGDCAEDRNDCLEPDLAELHCDKCHYNAAKKLFQWSFSSLTATTQRLKPQCYYCGAKQIRYEKAGVRHGPRKNCRQKNCPSPPARRALRHCIRCHLNIQTRFFWDTAENTTTHTCYFCERLGPNPRRDYRPKPNWP